MRGLLRAFLLVFGVSLLALSCDSASPVAPDGTLLTVTANPARIALTGSSTITVRGFRPNGSPLYPGTALTVSTDRGTLQPFATDVPGGLSVIAVDDNGVAVFRLVGDGSRGAAKVTVKAPPAEGEGTVTVEFGELDANRPTLVLSANPSTIAVLARSTVAILGRNPDNTPVASGQRIRLTADLGDLACTGHTTGGCTEVFTNTNGEAEAIFIAGDRGGSGKVSAILGTSAEVNVTISIRDAVASVALTANRQTVSRVENGETVNLTAVLQDAKGSPVSGIVVLFESQRGSLSQNRVPSNPQGEAATTLTVRRDDLRDIPQNGTFQVKATVTSEGQTVVDTLDITVLGAP